MLKNFLIVYNYHASNVRGRLGSSQVVMSLICWAIHMIQWFLQIVTWICLLVNLKNYLSSD